MSQHIGDLKNFETFQFYEETYNRFSSLFKFEPHYVVHDLHPDYLSTRFALKTKGIHIGVQHHHAHIATVTAEHHLNEKVIGICLDGTGYGTDGNIWGGEIFTCDYADCFRESHLQYINLPGGDRAAEEPWRMAASYLFEIYGENWKILDIPLVKELKKDVPQLELFASMLASGNHIKTSGAGRLFDAVAALTGLCKYSAYHAQAPMYLENAANKTETGLYNFEIKDSISFLPTIENIVKDIRQNTDIGLISARFHNTLVEALFQLQQPGLFQNRGPTKQRPLQLLPLRSFRPEQLRPALPMQLNRTDALPRKPLCDFHLAQVPPALWDALHLYAFHLETC
jgi:hydrogenase maturation protein HypF